jgi:hypothetical protein
MGSTSSISFSKEVGSTFTSKWDLGIFIAGV